jgi:hypothetical protein
MTPQGIAAFTHVFLSVDDHHRQKLRDISGQEGELYDKALRSHRHISQSALEAFLPNKERLSGDLYRTKEFIYLRPIQDDEIAGFILPVVSVRYDFQKEPIETCILLALAQMVNGQLRFRGFRFESPQGNGGQHDFYHAQLIRAFVRDGMPLNPPESDLANLPEKQPSFPLNAQCPVTLALAFFITLYGMPFLKEINKGGHIPPKYFEGFA